MFHQLKQLWVQHFYGNSKMRLSIHLATLRCTNKRKFESHILCQLKRANNQKPHSLPRLLQFNYFQHYSGVMEPKTVSQITGKLFPFNLAEVLLEHCYRDWNRWTGIKSGNWIPLCDLSAIFLSIPIMCCYDFIHNRRSGMST